MAFILPGRGFYENPAIWGLYEPPGERHTCTEGWFLITWAMAHVQPDPSCALVVSAGLVVGFSEALRRLDFVGGGGL